MEALALSEDRKLGYNGVTGKIAVRWGHIAVVLLLSPEKTNKRFRYLKSERKVEIYSLKLTNSVI